MTPTQKMQVWCPVIENTKEAQKVRFPLCNDLSSDLRNNALECQVCSTSPHDGCLSEHSRKLIEPCHLITC
jgi:hypothetical protein